MPTEVTVGIDIGTTSVKAVAADGDGRVVARAQVPHRLKARHAGELAHDAATAWRAGARDALGRVLAAEPEVRVEGVDVAAMVPSLCAVDSAGRPVSDGLLYGDERGAGGPRGADPSTSGELVRLLCWLAEHHPDAAGYWPAQAVANRALGGAGAIETTVAMTAVPLFDLTGWDAGVAASAGVDDVELLPRIVVGFEPVGTVPAAGDAVLGGGTVDALAEQMVAGADRAGDVLVVLGSTLVVWAVVPDWREVPGLWTVPHTAPGLTLVGGASNAGGLFGGWARRLLRPGADDPAGGATGVEPADRPEASDDRRDVGGPAEPPVDRAGPVDPGRVPVWQPYVRGERVPLHDPARRASLHDLDIGHDAGAVRRAAHEASAFAVRHILDRAGAAGAAGRIVATGGGVQDAAWLQALADGTGLPVDPAAVPEGAALGAAYLARVTAGREPDASGAARWSRYARRIEPDARWLAACDDRYARYRELVGDDAGRWLGAGAGDGDGDGDG
jgi:xylulokinase